MRRPNLWPCGRARPSQTLALAVMHSGQRRSGTEVAQYLPIDSEPREVARVRKGEEGGMKRNRSHEDTFEFL